MEVEGLLYPYIPAGPSVPDWRYMANPTYSGVLAILQLKGPTALFSKFFRNNLLI